jgi:hypothetical protein
VGGRLAITKVLPSVLAQLTRYGLNIPEGSACL